VFIRGLKFFVLSRSAVNFPKIYFACKV